MLLSTYIQFRYMDLKMLVKCLEFLLLSAIRRAWQLDINTDSLCSHFTQNKHRSQSYPISTLNPVKKYVSGFLEMQSIELYRIFFSSFNRILTTLSPYLKRPCGESLCCWPWRACVRYGLSLLGLRDVRGLLCLVS